MKDTKQENPKPIRKISNKRPSSKPPKFNIMWLYAVVILILLGVGWFSNSNNAKPTTFQDFELNMLKQHDVEKLQAYKNGDLITVEVFIKNGTANFGPDRIIGGCKQTVVQGINQGLPLFLSRDSGGDQQEKEYASAPHGSGF